MPYPDSKTSPWHHQIECWERAKDSPGFYVAHEMGAGKSKVAVDFCNGINAEKVLIICPKKVIGVWPAQFQTHSKTNYKILAEENGSIPKNAEKIKSFLSKAEGCPLAVVLNYERFWKSPIGPTHNSLNRITDLGLLSKVKWDLLIADEAHRIKKPGGLASWGMTRLANRIPRRLFLSGTPMPHSPLDLYAQFRALDPSIFGTKYSTFKARYCIMGGFENRQVIEYQNLDELHQKFYSIAHRVTIEEAVDLPEYHDVPLSVDLCPKAKKIYMQLERELIAECDNGQISTDNVLTKLLRLAQIAGGILRLDDGRVETIDTSKTDMAMEIIKDLPPNEPVVIFARFRPELKRMQAELTGIGRTVGEISGRTKNPDDLVGGAWTAGINNTLLVQIAAGGEGLDFTVSKYCIYLSKGYSNGQIKQSRARIHRPGQKRTVTYFNINARGTVDARIDQAIRFKNKITNSVLDIKDIVLNSLKETPDAEYREVDEVCETV